jgi:sugar phosphate isomerase/epimerase
VLTRRGFLGATGVTLAGAAGAGCGDNADPDRFAGFSIGVQSWSFRVFSLEEMLDMAARLGFAHVELTPGELAPGHLQFPASDAEIDALRAKIEARGLACLTAHVAPSGVDYPIDRAACAYGKRLGLRTIMATEVPADGAVLDALVAELDLKIGLHNHTGSRFDRIDVIQAQLAGRDPRIGTIIDTGHYTRVGLDPVAAIRAFAGRIAGIHLKDVVAANPAAPDAILGEGVVDLVAIFRALREVGLPADATISLEYESNPFMPFDDIARSLDHVAEAAHASRG